MKTKGGFLKGIVMLSMTLLVIWTSVSYVSADMGCHPDYQINIENLPSGYSCAIIVKEYTGATKPYGFWDEREKVNSGFHLDQVDKESIEEYLSLFYYDGWICYPDSLLYHSKGPWHYGGYMNPFPGRLLFISPEGEVTMSESMIEPRDYTYDFQKDRWVVSGSLGPFVSFITYLLVCYILTLVMEYAVFGSFGFSRVPQNRKKFFIANTASNIPMNLFLYTLYSASVGWNIWFESFIVLECIIMLSESIYYSHSLVNLKGEKRPKTAAAYGVLANFCSATVGMAYTMFDLHF